MNFHVLIEVCSFPFFVEGHVVSLAVPLAEVSRVGRVLSPTILTVVRRLGK